MIVGLCMVSEDKEVLSIPDSETKSNEGGGVSAERGAMLFVALVPLCTFCSITGPGACDEGEEACLCR
jgi:hypothetical protein